MTGPDDEISALARRFRDGDEHAFEALQHRVRERLYRLAYRLTGRRDDALDVVQDALFKAYRDIARWNERASFYSWLYRVATNLAIDRLRRRKRVRALHERLAARAGGPPRRGAEHIEHVDRRHDLDHQLARVRRALDRLPPGQRAVMVLRHFEGLSLAEIAEVRGCALGTVKSALHQAFKNLHAALLAPPDTEAQGRGHG